MKILHRNFQNVATLTTSQMFLIFLALMIFFILFWKDAGIIGPTEDEGYICKKDYRVLDINPDFTPSFERCETNFLFFKIISQNFPPVYSLSIRNIEIPVLVWPHITSLTYTPQAIFIRLCGIITNQKNLFTCEILFNFILVSLTIIVVFLISKELFDRYTAFLSAAIFSTLTSTRFFSYIGISIDFIFHTLYFWISVFLLIKFGVKEEKTYLLLSSIFFSFCVLSYLKFSSLLAIISFCFFVCRKEKIKNLVIFSIIPIFFLILFYVLPSIHISRWACPKKFLISSLLSTGNLIENVLKQYNLALIENKKGMWEDVFRMIDFTGYGNRFKYKDNLSFSFFPSLPFIISLIFCALKKEGRKIFFSFLLYNVFLFYDVPVLGYHRKLRPLMPLISIAIAYFTIYSIKQIKNMKAKRTIKLTLYFFVFSTLLYHLSYQVLKMEKIIKSTIENGFWSIKTSYMSQEELVKTLVEIKKEEKEAKIILFSGVVNFDILTNCAKIIDEDFSYLIHFSPSGFTHTFVSVVYKTILKESEKNEIYIVSDRFGYSILKGKKELVLKYGIGPKNDSIFFIFSVRPEK